MDIENTNKPDVILNKKAVKLQILNLNPAKLTLNGKSL